MVDVDVQLKLAFALMSYTYISCFHVKDMLFLNLSDRNGISKPTFNTCHSLCLHMPIYACHSLYKKKTYFVLDSFHSKDHNIAGFFDFKMNKVMC